MHTFSGQAHEQIVCWQVVHWKSGAAIGHVMDVYDGTGMPAFPARGFAPLQHA